MLISDVLVVEGRGFGCQIVSVGLVLADGFVAWGECMEQNAGGNASLVVSRASFYALLQTVVAPMLRGRRVADFELLTDEMESLTDVVKFVETIQPDPPPRPAGVSRRGLLRGQWGQASPPMPTPIVNKYEEVQPIPSALRYGVSQAIVRAAAHVEGVLPALFLTTAYNLPLTTTPPPVQVRFKSLNQVGDVFAYDVGSVGVEFAGINARVEIGADGELAQKMMRGLREKAVANSVAPSLYLAVNGGYGNITNNQVGKILGNLSGLSSVAKPFSVYAEDPIQLENRADHIKKLASLMEFVRFRQLDLKLVARYHVDSVAEVPAFIASGATHLLYLDPQQLGSIRNLIEAVKMCQAGGVGVMLGGNVAGATLTAQLATQIAIAIQPDFVVIEPAAMTELVSFHNETRRILALLEKLTT